MIDLLVSIDKKVFLVLHQLNSPALNSFMIFLSSQLIWIPFVAFFIFLFFKFENKNNFKFYLLFLVMTFVLSDVTSSYILKNIFTRLRPCRDQYFLNLIIDFGQRCGGKFGFVSSHASNSLGLIYFSLNSLQLNSKWYLFLLLPILVGVSRIYLGVHYPGDILGGYFIGLFWASLLSWSYKQIKVPTDTYPTLN